MTSESKPVIGSLSGISSWKPPTITGSSSVQQLFDFLKSPSQEKEYSLVEKILSEREIGLRRDYESANREREWAKEEQSRLEIEIVKLRDELKNLRREYDNLTENKIRLEEEKKVLVDRERRSEERYKKVYEELLNEQNEKSKVIFGMKQEIEKLKSDKNEAEKRREASEKRFQVLDERVSRLEKDIAAKAGLDVSIIRKIAENRYDVRVADNGTQTRTPDAIGSSKSKMIDASPITVASPVVVLSDSDDDETPVDEGASLAKLSGSKVLRQTEKSSAQKNEEKEEERMKRKRSSNKSHDGASVQNGSKRCALVPSKGGSSMDSEDSGTHLDSHKTKGRGPWLLEPDMCLEFENDPELCMNAVCALFRQQISPATSMKSLDREYDIVRVAKYLIHDHPENKLKRSVTEVSKDIIVKCKRLALHHSGELFRIYCSGKDPFFCYKAICCKF